MWRRASIFVVLPFLLVAAAGTAQSLAQNTVPVFDAAVLRESADLSTTWLIEAGDDRQYARADFDDSRWLRFDPHRNVKNYLKTAPSVVWYRLHVKTDPGQTGLTLRELNTARAFEVYVNGERVMVSGRVDPFAPATMQARLLARIPDRMTATGALVIALRVHISQEEWKSAQNSGYYAGNLTLGQWDTLYRENWLEIIGQTGL